MKLKKNFILREVADVWVVLPTSSDMLDFDGMLTLNDTGAFLWNKLENENCKEDLVSAMTGEYDIDSQTAESDIEEFLDKLRQAGCLVE